MKSLFENDHVANLVIAVVSFFLLIGSFKLNEYLDPYMLYAPGVSLVFVPAGIKLLCLLVGGFPAIIGVLAASAYISTGLWNNNTFSSTFALAIVSVLTYYTAVIIITRFFKIRDDLSNLNYWHIVLLSTLGSVLNGFLLNLAYYSQHVTAENEVLSKGAAMILGDFTGCFIIVMLFHLAINAFRRQASNPK